MTSSWFLIPQLFEFGVVKSGERAGQLMSPNRVAGGETLTKEKKVMLALPCGPLHRTVATIHFTLFIRFITVL